MKQQPLFGKADQIYSAIATEKAIVSAEITALDKSIERREREKGLLEDRRANLAAALKLLEAKTKTKKK